MAKLTDLESTRLFIAHQLVQRIATTYRAYPVHPNPERLNLGGMEELLALFPAEDLSHLEQFGQALGMDFIDEEHDRLLRIKFVLGDPTDACLSYLLGFDGPEMENKLSAFLKGCNYYLSRRRQEMTLLVVVLRPMAKKLQTAIFKLQEYLGVKVELFSVHTELQLDPFQHVLQSEQHIASEDFLRDEGVIKETLNRELVYYGIANNETKGLRGSITAKFLGARHDDVIVHRQAITTVLAGDRTTLLRRVEAIELPRE